MNIPFNDFRSNFLLKLSYKLNDNILLMGFTIENLANQDMPVSFGGHPAFNISSPKDAYLEFDKDNELYSFQLKDGLISENAILVSEKKGMIEISDSTFNNDALIFKKLKSDYITLKSKSNSSCVRVGIQNWHFFRNMGKTCRKFHLY
jgi:galactose mutarotase-like enzyme